MAKKPRLASNGHLYGFRTFIVEGDGRFPIDCLRYDAAWPAEERDSHAIAGDHDAERRAVALRTRWPFAPTRDKWRAYGWQVTCVDGDKMIPATPATMDRIMNMGSTTA